MTVRRRTLPTALETLVPAFVESVMDAIREALAHSLASHGAASAPRRASSTRGPSPSGRKPVVLVRPAVSAPVERAPRAGRKAKSARVAPVVESALELEAYGDVAITDPFALLGALEPEPAPRAAPAPPARVPAILEVAPPPVAPRAPSTRSRDDVVLDARAAYVVRRRRPAGT